MHTSTTQRSNAAALLWLAASATFLAPANAESPVAAPPPPGGALDGNRHRVLVSTDIGGTDPDDFQSMVHLLVYADSFDIEGLVSSPYGPGRIGDILQVIDCYAQDYCNLLLHSDHYPSPDELREIAKQGETDRAPFAGFRNATEGSDWIIACARRDDPRPLYVLVWGGLEDLAQALHDAPDILPRLRVYWIGGPNKKWSPDAYQYLVTHHPSLWLIEANATYRGWFVGGVQDGRWGNSGFVRRHVAGRGALGEFFASQLGGTIKMGDTPSVSWLLKGDPADPTASSWGGRFVRAWERPYVMHEGLPSTSDQMEVFGVLEIALPLGAEAPDAPDATLDVENQSLHGHPAKDGTIRIRFCPKATKTYQFTIDSNVASLDGLQGGITAVPPPPDVAQPAAVELPQWWTDDPHPSYAVDGHVGAQTVSRWRRDFLQDFADRIARCSPAQR